MSNEQPPNGPFRGLLFALVISLPIWIVAVIIIMHCVQS